MSDMIGQAVGNLAAGDGAIADVAKLAQDNYQTVAGLGLLAVGSYVLATSVLGGRQASFNGETAKTNPGSTGGTMKSQTVSFRTNWFNSRLGQYFSCGELDVSVLFVHSARGGENDNNKYIREVRVRPGARNSTSKWCDTSLTVAIDDLGPVDSGTGDGNLMTCIAVRIEYIEKFKGNDYPIVKTLYLYGNGQTQEA